MSEYILSEINIYPVKSLPGISRSDTVVEERGFRFDRRWMLVDEENNFITQRRYPQMVFVNLKFHRDILIFTQYTKSLPPLNISVNKFPQKEITVQIWDDKCYALEYGDKINEWFSKAIDFKCKLVYMPDNAQRKTSTKYFEQSKVLSFADGYPYLIIGEKSLHYLNSKLNNPVKMTQFRPNIVFRGGKEHDEDLWNKIKIGSINFAVVKPCARCVITTVDPTTGEKNKEPLTTLSSYRKLDNKIMFGQNAIALSQGILSVGDKITIRS